MIGHTFNSSGAVCLALAPSERSGDYAVLARTDEGGYAVALLLDRVLIEAAVEGKTGPDRWMSAEYVSDLDEAVRYFCELTGTSADVVTRDARRAEDLLAERVPGWGTPVRRYRA